MRNITLAHTSLKTVHTLYFFTKLHIVFLSLLFTPILLLITRQYKSRASTHFNILQHILMMHLVDPKHPSLFLSTPNQHWHEILFTWATFLSSLISHEWLTRLSLWKQLEGATQISSAVGLLFPTWSYMSNYTAPAELENLAVMINNLGQQFIILL